MDLSWSESALGDFDRYEVYRSTSANVSVANDLVFSSSTSTDTTFTDTGLSIGATYYYKVFVFNSRQVATPSNERLAITVPLTFPFSDPMESLDNWDATGIWGPDGTSAVEGSFSLNDSPVDNSTPSSTTYILTAIDVSGSTWPVLRFWDRFALSDDWGYLEVSPNGTSWYRVYTVTGPHTSWSEHSIDLSPWKTATNLRIRFTVATGGSNVDEGWYIDDLSVAEHPGSAVSLPFFDDMESGTANWLVSTWEASTDNPHGGTTSALSLPQSVMQSSTEHVMVLGGDLDLSSTVNPQLTYWIRGVLTYRGGFQAQVSTDGGIGWTTLPNTGIGESTIPEWRRYQVSLDTYRQSGVKIRFRVSQGSTYAGNNIIFLDDVSIEEMPMAVTLATPDQVTISSMRLQWNDLNDPAFSAYALYRSETSTVDTNSHLWRGLTTRPQPSLSIRIFRRGGPTSTGSSSSTPRMSTRRPTAPRPRLSECRCRLPTTSKPTAGSGPSQGTGAPSITAGTGGSTSLGDSPGDFTPNVDTWAVTGVDLSATVWPVVTFDERFDFAGHWGRLEISSNGGATWTVLYGATSSQPGWVNRRFDLSPWRGQTQVWIRFFARCQQRCAVRRLAHRQPVHR